ncbi:hypothetical protein CEUSTIGMA_g12515.t1 [Chlamydomonas eustigma]|uniref:Peptidyl-prolyl cis-trans isomerase n=1 Tax=Chlamydomonas eustigma TaxID=1157962 RepID=A0A250XPV4_9CHLO|nr:hypothetical protein CEUSTIGMA_g12515.t1 [Chlamydomonas eustigma]|eukprot:GAX85095.1 hypothetical protein CEUSTIGMA_g12515.t1 [Chlamydomonas eustigma]
MAVLLETSKGDIVIDLFIDDCPITCKNFIKLCKLKYYNNCIFHNVQQNFIIQSGDPTATGKGGSSVYGLLYGEQARFFEDELRPHLKHKKRGVVGMASAGKNMNASQFYITTGDALHSLDEKHTIFGQVAEGLDVVDKIDEAFCDDEGRPFQNIRIRHTIILDDPFEDPAELGEQIPEQSPEPQFEQGGRLEEDWTLTSDTRPIEEVEQEGRRAEAHNRAVVLEMIGDLPEADAAPPSNMLFVCKLNPVTTEEDLEIIFSRFGRVNACDIIRDWKTGDSLCYGFIGLESDAACEEAYFKMNNVLIDDRRIKVDFSQSVHHLWKQFKKGGRKGGDANMAAEASRHERSADVVKDRLQAKSHQTEHMAGRCHDMLMDDLKMPDFKSEKERERSKDSSLRHTHQHGSHARYEQRSLPQNSRQDHSKRNRSPEKHLAKREIHRDKHQRHSGGHSPYRDSPERKRVEPGNRSQPYATSDYGNDAADQSQRTHGERHHRVSRDHYSSKRGAR